MAKTYTAEYVTKLKLDYKEATKNLDEFQKEYSKLEKQVQNQNNATSKSIKNIEKSSDSAAKGIKGIATAIKAAGVGLLIAAFAKLTEVFNQNQKVADFFNTTFEVLSLAFNDFFNFLNRNVGTITGYFKSIFDNPVESIKNFGVAIKNNIVERFKSALETLGLLGKAVVKVFKGDFAGAAETAKEAGKEFLDVVTGVDGTFEKTAEVLPKIVKGVSDYAKSTWQTATNMVELNKQAKLNEVINQGLIEKYDRQAEKLRQIRDDETISIDKRIEANEKLGKVLDEQEAKMLENAQARIRSAELELSKNRENIDAQIEYQAALNEQASIESQIEGFRSEQLTNRISLQKEVQDAEQELRDKETEEINDALKKNLELRKKSFEAEKQITKDTQEFNKEAIKQGISGISSLVGENSKFGKGIAIASAVRDTYSGATKALAQGGIFGAIGAAGIIAAGLANVRAISATDDPAPPSFASGAGGRGVSAPVIQQQAPEFNVVGASGTNQLAEAISGQQSKPQRAYVVSNDVTTAQSLERNIVEGASI